MEKITTDIYLICEKGYADAYRGCGRPVVFVSAWAKAAGGNGRRPRADGPLGEGPEPPLAADERTGTGRDVFDHLLHVVKDLIGIFSK